MNSTRGTSRQTTLQVLFAAVQLPEPSLTNISSMRFQSLRQSKSKQLGLESSLYTKTFSPFFHVRMHYYHQILIHGLDCRLQNVKDFLLRELEAQNQLQIIVCGLKPTFLVFGDMQMAYCMQSWSFIITFRSHLIFWLVAWFWVVFGRSIGVFGWVFFAILAIFLVGF